MPRPVVIADAATLDPRTGYYHLRDQRFADVELVGPAVVLIRDNFTLNDTAFSGAEFETLFRRVEVGEKIPVGAIVADGLAIERCTLRNISFLADENVLSRAGLDLLR